MGNLEALGDAITGGVIARAIEPSAGESDGHTSETECLNCGAPLAGPYCSQCGQHAHVHRTLHAFFHDLLHGVLHFEGKIWRTLPLLAWRPGELTRRYIDGQRARFVSPIALFLFCVFLTFAVMGLAGSLGHLPRPSETEVASDLAKDQQRLERYRSQRQERLAAGRSTQGADEKIAEVEAEIRTLQALQHGNAVELFNAQRARDRGAQFETAQVDTSALPLWVKDAVGNARENPELVFYKLKTNAYKFSWALIPLSVPFVWLLFPFSRRFRLYDHTVFVTYSLCFMMLLLVGSTLLGLVAASIAALAWLVPPFHMYRQLRGTYGVTTFGALWRTAALTLFAFIAISLFASLLLTLGAFD